MWLFKRAMKCLPAATGPFMPGCMDVMLGYDQESPMLRLFYPTNAKKDEKENTKKYVPWLPDDSYLVGISRVLMLHLYIVRLLLWWRGRTYVPVLYGEKIRTNEKLKCIVMSHGLGGSRFLYSNICYELASNGFLVLCLEHKEMSACNTYFYANQEDARNDKRTIIDFRHIALGENHYTERNEQIKFRSKECNKVVQFLEDLNGGNVPYNVVADVPTEHDILFDLNDLVANLDLENLTMMGHSFGGATALNTIANNKKFKQCILLDPWMFPIKNENLEEKIEQSLLFINTQTFHIASNVKAMAKLLDRDNRKMNTILHTTHENQTDSVLLIGYWLNWFMRKIDPQVALKINNALILEFLSAHISYPSDVDWHRKYLVQQKHNIECGLTRPWA